MYDLVVRDGSVVTDDGCVRADVGISDGKIAALGHLDYGRHEIDASGHLVLPGGIDPHTHFESRQRVDGPISPSDYSAGTLAAAFGGVTTVIDYVMQRAGSTLDETASEAVQRASAHAYVDFGLHLGLSDTRGTTLASIPSLVRRGFPTFKLFLNRFSDADFEEALRAIRDAGGMAMLHCEDADLEAEVRELILADGASATALRWSELRPAASEHRATERAIAFVARTGCPAYVVHVSTRHALGRLQAARASGIPIWVEVRPVHLILTHREYETADYLTYTGYPPLRSQSDVEGLGRGLILGAVDVIASDHAGWTSSQKEQGAEDVTLLPVGMAGVETLRPAVFDAFVATDRLSAGQFAAFTAGNAAKACGLAPAKGDIAVGSDADVVVWDPRTSRRISASMLHGNVDIDPFEGRELIGFARDVVLHGHPVIRNGQRVQEAPQGRFIPRQLTVPSSPLASN